MSLIRLIARPMLASSFVASGLARLRDTDTTAESLRPALHLLEGTVPAAKGLGDQERLVAKGVGAAQVGAGALLAIGKFPRFSAFVLAITAALTATAEFKNNENAPHGASKLNALLKNISLIGGVLVASVDRDGKPSMAWRAQQAAEDAKKVSKKTAKKVKKEANQLAEQTGLARS